MQTLIDYLEPRQLDMNREAKCVLSIGSYSTVSLKRTKPPRRNITLVAVMDASDTDPLWSRVTASATHTVSNLAIDGSSHIIFVSSLTYMHALSLICKVNVMI